MRAPLRGVSDACLLLVAWFIYSEPLALAVQVVPQECRLDSESPVTVALPPQAKQCSRIQAALLLLLVA